MQLYSSMLIKSLRYGFVSTEICTIYIRIDSSDPSIVDYHTSCPESDVNIDDGKMNHSAVSKLFAFTVLALKDRGTSEEWKAVAAKRPRWFSQRVNQNNIKLDRKTPEDDITPYHSKPLDSRDRERDLRVTRSASRTTHHPPNEVDNEKEASGSGSKMGSSHIDRREFLRLMGKQLVCKDAHAHFKPINASGHIRYLLRFAYRRIRHGYTFVAKAVGLFDGAPLLHEEKMYNHLRDLQGRSIPACPGLIPLHGVFGGQAYDYIAFRHFLFLSYAGKPVLKALSKVDNSVVNL
ncbi:uncharacterized protein CPUR_03218 [Claviceps purpurea 20.1]|uniref:Uncharacterized protein n=1 Tax=Claviceps purpurea (strain 20.1) TaxID=1111077 RepID=M1WE35_CLAP2|nr:uncharacterized protein CPUR_03218 [Claviceps purpurea 20.1]